MEKDIYYKGNIYINDNILQLENTTINLQNITDIAPCYIPRHSIFSGLKAWLYGLLIMVIISLLNNKISFLGDLYIYTIFILLIYNLFQFRKKYYGLEIATSSGRRIYLKSRDANFINEVHKTIIEAMKNKKSKYEINLSSKLINNGIINNGNNNINKVVHKK